jgi:phosphoglycolate phosphatase/pyrophosphatase PpaX
MNKRSINAILWDLDGTLVSTKRLYLEAYRRALAPYIGRVLTDEEILGHRSRSEIRFLKSQAVERYEDCLRDFRRFYADLHETHFGGVYPGVPGTLDTLRNHGVKMGIVTGKSRTSYEVQTVSTDLGPFDILVMDDDVHEPKPSPEGILIAVERLGTAPSRTVYVGDSVTDVEAATAAGVISAAALWSRPDRGDHAQRMLEAGAAELLDAPMDALRFI